MSYKYETAAPDRYDLLKTFAKYNRREMTQSETILWKALRKELRAYRFRRQHPIGDYIADFVCLIAYHLDSASPEGVLGTIAGDDTIFVVINQEIPIKQVSENIAAALKSNQ